ncbi:MAG: PorP/SprF family type IX secretion system membrane protein [Bacteroidia bacterium]|nr:PorP/SprF family type IX secretion system membrane protein [Bacteroidia bacterium]MCZ2277357.1 PorP/SprF family type IX secretion system membrane protein [Bacteroidia bacterium]
MSKPRILFLFVMLLSFSSVAQDIHFSQFGKSPLNLNPAYAGFMDADYRISGIHRNQWKSVSVPFKTFSGSLDIKHHLTSREQAFIGTGIFFNSDKAGDSDFGITQAGISLSYITAIGSSGSHYATIGIQPLFSQISLNYSKLTFDNQFDGDVFNPAIPPAEIFNNDKSVNFDLAAGFSYLYQPSEQFQIGAGLSVHHLLNPHYSFFSDHNAGLPVKTSIDLNSSIAVTEKFFIQPAILFSTQEKFREIVPGGTLKFLLNERPGRKINIMAGLYFRSGDALIPMIGLDYNELNIGFSYDINTSDLNRASNHRGGYEIALTYLITKVKPLGLRPPCPVY